jgi:hypothetical protein
VRIGAKPITRDEVESAWPGIKGYVAEALAHGTGRMGPDDVLRYLVSGEMQAFIVFDADAAKLLAVLVTEVMDYPTARVLDLALCAGERLDLWISALPWLEGFAKQAGCTQMQVHGRAGWSRVLAPRGFREAARVLLKGVRHG